VLKDKDLEFANSIRPFSPSFLTNRPVESWPISLGDSPSWFDFVPQNMAESVDGH
jgi:hypothetical protein